MAFHRTPMRPPSPGRGWPRARIGAPAMIAPGPYDIELPETCTSVDLPAPQLDEAQRFLQQLSAVTEGLLRAATEDAALAAVAAAGRELFPGWAGRLTRPGGVETSHAWQPPQPQRAPDASTPLHTLRLCVPPSAQDGAHRLDLQLDHAGELSPRQLGLAANGAKALAAALDLALANLGMRRSLQEQALRDALTGLHNRRHFDDALAHEAARAQRDGSVLGLALLDIDHFKAFNDEFGHPAGDAVLRAVGRAVQQAVRRSDIACRFGGEEIALLLPQSSAEGAIGHLEALCRRLAALELTFEGRRLPQVTVSIGVARVQGARIDAADLLRRADQALYAAKRQGRNRVVAWNEPATPDPQFPSSPSPSGASAEYSRKRL